MKNLQFWLRILITILTALAGALGASACGLSEGFSALTGFVIGSTWEYIPSLARI